MLKYTIVPSSFFRRDDSYNILSQAVQLEGNDKVEYQELPDFQAVLVYATTLSGEAPAVLEMLRAVSGINEYNKVLANYDGSHITVVVAAGSKLLLANSYPSTDCVTGEYFIFSAMKQFQINPEVTTGYLYGDAPFDMKNDLFRYCKGVERL